MLCAALGCDDPAPDLAEWTPADHHNQGDRKPRKQAGKPSTYTQPSKRNVLVEVTWQKQCASCHGKRGRGDGPQSAMFKARDLSAIDWQEGVSDEEIAKVIREGRNKMPAFNFPDTILGGLVSHVRGLKRAVPGARGAGRGQDDDDEAEATPAPAAASAPAAAPAAPAPAAAAPAGSTAPAAGANAGH